MMVTNDVSPVRVESDPAAERVLCARLTAGDAAAFSEVYARFAGYVYGLARRVVRDTDRAEEVTQDVFCQLWENPTRFDADRGSLRAFLGVLTHRRAVDHVRRSEARRRRECSNRSHQPVAVDIGAAVGESIARDSVRQAVDALPDDQRQPVLLAYFGGRTFREVAETLNIPEGTAKSRIRAALDKLANMLDEGLITS